MDPMLEALNAGLPDLGLSCPQARRKPCAPLDRLFWKKIKS